MTAAVQTPAAVYLPHLTNGDGAAAARSHRATHPEAVLVQFEGGNYNSQAVAKRDFRKGDVVARFNHATLTDAIRYSTVQVAEDKHIELNSDLLYCNHSCDPTLIFNVSGGSTPQDWFAAAARDIKAGEKLTFCTRRLVLYPSTEWHMTQPFQCECGAQACLGTIAGAQHLTDAQLAPFFLNDHIHRLKAKSA
ncbi:hypothetical protein MSPP1_000282 [Malassezia sp. CBS 17886]|nr:hypothetical protein MSPP1_000282 [Malassezia sp. CBS 17886]